MIDKIVPAGGKHILLDLYGVEPEKLTNAISLHHFMAKASIEAGATILADNFHHFGEGYGVTGVLVLSESHMTIHTWPENGFASLDIYMCGDSEPEKAIPVLLGFFKPELYDLKVIERGIN